MQMFLLERRLWHRCFLWMLARIYKNTYFAAHQQTSSPVIMKAPKWIKICPPVDIFILGFGIGDCVQIIECSQQLKNHLFAVNGWRNTCVCGFYQYIFTSIRLQSHQFCGYGKLVNGIQKLKCPVNSLKHKPLKYRPRI